MTAAVSLTSSVTTRCSCPERQSPQAVCDGYDIGSRFAPFAGPHMATAPYPHASSSVTPKHYGSRFRRVTVDPLHHRYVLERIVVGTRSAVLLSPGLRLPLTEASFYAIPTRKLQLFESSERSPPVPSPSAEANRFDTFDVRAVCSSARRALHAETRSSPLAKSATRRPEFSTPNSRAEAR